MEKNDVDYLPIFTREGASWGKLNKVSDGELKEIIHEINLILKRVAKIEGDMQVNKDKIANLEAR